MKHEAWTGAARHKWWIIERLCKIGYTTEIIYWMELELSKMDNGH